MYSKGRDSAVDVVVMAEQEQTWSALAVEIDGIEHERASAAEADTKRICSAEMHSELDVLRLRLAEQHCWRQQLVCFNAAL